VALVSDDVVGPLYADQVAASLESTGLQVAHCTMLAGEVHKTLDTVSDLYAQFLAAGLDRGGLVVALGGGVVGDVLGFAAATYMRGLPVVQIPTTLLAMVDSSVGGKTGVDLPAGKNLVGAFKQPVLVAIDPAVLATLPAADFRAGLAEVAKAGVIGSPGLFQRLGDGHTDLSWIVREAVAVKIDVVEADPYERGRRAVLNLGHTFAHAFERLSDYQLRHGEAVAMGMAVAARLAVDLGHCTPDVGGRIIALLNHLGLPTAPPNYEPEAVWDAMTSDKKKQGKQLRFVLPLDIGQVDVFDDVPREAVLATLARG
jgi:3-dehydroquinate synthase